MGGESIRKAETEERKPWDSAQLHSTTPTQHQPPSAPFFASRVSVHGDINSIQWLSSTNQFGMEVRRWWLSWADRNRLNRKLIPHGGACTRQPGLGASSTRASCCAVSVRLCASISCTWEDFRPRSVTSCRVGTTAYCGPTSRVKCFAGKELQLGERWEAQFIRSHPPEAEDAFESSQASIERSCMRLRRSMRDQRVILHVCVKDNMQIMISHWQFRSSRPVYDGVDRSN